MRVDVDAQGRPWVVNDKGVIYRLDGSKWTKVPGWASDISVAANGQVFVLGKGGVPFRRDRNKWVKLPGNAVHIGAGVPGKPWVVGPQGGSVAGDGGERTAVAAVPKP